ncbi:50S ribosomal protein L31 [Candidatus Phytoplasma australiense]|uniref:50S ribosomal protein L31 n=2 Tax=Phytoplasma australiense TaxID=59748 RepID=B1VAS5_PHYAS|nr:50S ribosomal protein L31 [Candidatus Phytoplasma australiense]AGL90465.1 50S ribosomal protein L31 [Strawberry lethal yellows phytoplasma (CPA) str. NZSb11]CAM12048.1 50S ribosomal protein L31 [Candidatus Phytoplasma australiense]
MKNNIHPKSQTVKISCPTCERQYQVETTVPSIKIETCFKCGPFYTGSQNFVVAAGPIDKFNKRYNVNTQKSVDQKEKNK